MNNLNGQGGAMVENYRRRGGHGGKRAGSGPKRRHPPYEARVVHLTAAQVELLRMWGGGDVSAGARWLIDQAAPLVGEATVVLVARGD